jgi:DNA-binding NarL/FixJ family response regulator
MSEPVAGEKKKVFVVEDHLLFRAMLVRLIESEAGMSVCGVADNVKDAMALIEQTRPDLAIVDLMLRGPGGLELIRELKAAGNPLPVLVLSMHDESLYAERALRAGARGYVSKQESPDTVIAAMRQVVGGRIYLSEKGTGTILVRLLQSERRSHASGFDVLSDRETEVFQLIGSGMNSREISEGLSLAITTVDSYKERIKEKLGIKNAAELYQRAAQWMLQNND